MTIREFQALIDRMYSERDRQRGAARTFLWFMEEVGELASAIAARDRAGLPGEFADVFAWLCTLANVEGVDLQDALDKFAARGCPGCGQEVCVCREKMT